MPQLPFSIFKRKGRQFYYVQFKSKKGGYLPAVSTKQLTEAAAIETAFLWLREGKPDSMKRKAPYKTDSNSLPLLSSGTVPQSAPQKIKITLRDILRDITNTAEAEFVCKELKRLGLLKAYVIEGSKQAIKFIDFLDNFWDFDSSPYVKAKLRKSHAIHRDYTIDQKNIAKKYWEPYFKDKLLGDITRQDIEDFMDSLSEIKISSRKKVLFDNDKKLPVKISNSIIEDRNLSAGRKNKIMRAGIIPLRWAFTKEYILKNVATGITWFSEKSAKKHILSPEIVQAIFNIEWSDIRSYLANLLASLTGLRAGEIQGLRVQDLGKECLYIKHSWNGVDKLKPTKNNEVRTVELPFPDVIKALLNLAARNPHGADMDSFVFWAEKSSSKPMEGHLFVKGLRKALINVGMSKESASAYVFHGWRHYFTSYMISKLEKKLLKSQTGHKTDAMISLYGDHWTEGDREKIRQAQQEVFGALVPTQSLVPLLQAG